MLNLEQIVSKLARAAVCLILCQTGLAEDQDKSPIIVKKVGEPVIIQLPNGNTVELKQLERLIPLSSTITLSENSCSSRLGLKWGYVVPVIVRSLIPVWKTHPTKRGESVTRFNTDEKRNEVASETSLHSRNGKSSFFEADLARMISEDMQVQEIQRIAVENPSAVGWFECKDSCEGVLPKDVTALLWDENFEMANSELDLTRKSQSTAVNQITSRFEGIPLKVSGNRIEFGRPRKAYGGLSAFLPMGVTYQIQLSFQAPNLFDPDDNLCEMKWDMDFTSIFTQFTQAINQVRDTERIKLLELTNYSFRAEDEANDSFNGLFSDWTFRGEEYKK